MRRGDAALEADQLAPACADYLSATEFYWLALRGTHLPQAERRGLEDAHVGAFRAAIPLLPHVTTPFCFEVDGVAIAGYLFAPPSALTTSPTVIWTVDPDTTVESSYRQVALPILGSGIACAVFTFRFPRGIARSSTRIDAVVDAVTDWVRLRRGAVEPLTAPWTDRTAS